MKTLLVPIETMKKGDQWTQHGGVFELLEDVRPSHGHVNNWDGIGPSDVVAAQCVCVSGECGGYFKPGSDWTLQGRINLVTVHKLQ